MLCSFPSFNIIFCLPQVPLITQNMKPLSIQECKLWLFGLVRTVHIL